MQFDYLDMLSGEPIYLEGVGHLKSPALRDIKPMTGIGHGGYRVYLNFLSWDKSQLSEYNKIMRFRNADKIDIETLNVFDVATLLKQTREFCRGILSFFMVEKIEWDDAQKCYFTFSDEAPDQVVGTINRDNFDDVRKHMLKLNYIGVDEKESPITHENEEARKMWERAQKYLAEQARDKASEDKPEYHLSNIISKVCTVHPSYNLLNVYDLTIFQLYDAFFQIGYMRSIDLNEKIFSNHGGDKFSFEDWMKPFLKNL